MSTESFRSAVNAELVAWQQANFPTLPLIFENGPAPDEQSIGLIWLDAEIRWYGGVIASVGAAPLTRNTGALSFMCYYKDGEGTQQSDQVIDSLANRFKARRLGGGVLLAPQRTVPTHLRGWYKTGILIPLRLD